MFEIERERERQRVGERKGYSTKVESVQFRANNTLTRKRTKAKELLTELNSG